MINQNVEKIVDVYKSTIWKKGTDELNLKTVKSIAKQVGIKSPSVHKDSADFIYINCECIDPYGGSPEKEVRNVINFCEVLIKKYGA